MVAATTPIGVIGLGLMGTAMTRRLLGAGLTVAGYDVQADKRAAFAAAGGAARASVAEVGRDCACVILSVFNMDQVIEVVEGEGGLARTMPRAGVIVVTSTVDPEKIAALASRVSGQGVAVLEVPISGTSSQVAAGDGVGLIAGDAGAAERASAVLDAIVPRRYFLGAPGNGAKAKLAVNLILGLNRAALAEGLMFAGALGLDPVAFLEVAKGSAAYSQAMDIKGPLMARRSYSPPLSRVDQSLKDFSLMVEQGAKLGKALPFARLYVDMMQDCMAQGDGALDNAIILEAISRRTIG